MPSAPGPYRYVHDIELRDIFFLTPQSGTSFFLTQDVGPFPGSTSPAVTPVLRSMLYLMTMTRPEQIALKRMIGTTLAGREQIVIRAKLLSLVDHILVESWRFPALLDTATCKEAFHELTGIAAKSNTVASTAADPITDLGVTAGIKKLFDTAEAGIAFFGLTLVRYFGGKSKDHYAFYAKRISDELALRGIAPSTLQ